MSSDEDEVVIGKGQKVKIDFNVDENFYYCCSINCWQRIPCVEHQMTGFANPQRYFQNCLMQASNDTPALVSTLQRWAAWVLQQTDENKWEVAACLQTQALAVHLQEPRVPNEDYSEETERREAEWFQSRPQKPPTQAPPEELAKYEKEIARIHKEREERAAARQARHVKRTQQHMALGSIWKQISVLAHEFFAAESTVFFECITVIDTFRTKLASSAVRGSRDWPSKKTRIAQHYSAALSNLMEQCLDLAGVEPQDVSVMLLGSLAKREGMPYSDVELAILLNERNILDDVWKAIRFFRFLIILCGETPFPVLPEKMGRMFPAEGGWSFTPVGLHMDTGVTLVVADLPTMVGMQETFSVTSTALRQVAHLYGDPVPVQTYQTAIADYWNTKPLARRMTAKQLLVTAMQKYEPDSVGDTVSLKMIYRMLSLGLEALALWHGLFVVGTLATISLLRARGVLQWDTAAQIGSLLDILMTTRMNVQNRAKSQDDNATLDHIPPQLLTLANEFYGGLVTYLQLLGQVPSTVLNSVKGVKPIIFKLEEIKKDEAPVETAQVLQPVAHSEPERKNDGSSCLPKLVMVKDHLQKFVSLATRMALGASCKGLRSVSPGPVTVIKIDSTADAKMFVDGPPTLGSHILRLGGYWAKERPYSKRHAIPKSRWDAYHAEDGMRKETMRFEADTLKTLMQIRPYHRVVGMEFDKGRRDTTEADYQEFWALVAPHIGWLGLSDQTEIELGAVGRMLKSRPFVGSYFKISGCGNCWPFLTELLQASRGLEGLSFAWTGTDDSYYHGPKYHVAPRAVWEQLRLPLRDLQYIHAAVPPSENIKPANSYIIGEWLVPNAVNLRKFSGQVLELNAPWPRSVQVINSSSSQIGKLATFLMNLNVPAFVQSGIWGAKQDWGFTNPRLLHLHLGHMGWTEPEELIAILKAFPSLLSFSIRLSKPIPPPELTTLISLLPNAEFVLIAEKTVVFSKQGPRPEFLSAEYMSTFH